MTVHVTFVYIIVTKHLLPIPYDRIDLTNPFWTDFSTVKLNLPLLSFVNTLLDPFFVNFSFLSLTFTGFFPRTPWTNESIYRILLDRIMKSLWYMQKFTIYNHHVGWVTLLEELMIVDLV